MTFSDHLVKAKKSFRKHHQASNPLSLSKIDTSRINSNLIYPKYKKNQSMRVKKNLPLWRYKNNRKENLALFPRGKQVLKLHPLRNISYL